MAIICVLGYDFRIISVASIPFISGILISISTTSMWSVIKKFKASAAQVNVFLSKILAFLFRINSKPFNTNGWSSIMMTVMTLSIYIELNMKRCSPT
ncbi:Uncharacterised protein [Mycobacterium tuberculosis]|nr:Uncharacterised protein [Mycobacterium tuberculosis]